MTDVRLFAPADWTAVWAILEPVFRAGETYAFAPDLTEAEAHHLWIDMPEASFVATDADGAVLGTYYLRPNHAGPGGHVCNSGYVVADSARGRGVASALCEHSQREAVARGYRAMQFNMVASTNEGAVRLWQRHGFTIAGTLPGAFHHPRHGDVDAYIMFKTL